MSGYNDQTEYGQLEYHIASGIGPGATADIETSNAPVRTKDINLSVDAVSSTFTFYQYDGVTPYFSMKCAPYKVYSVPGTFWPNGLVINCGAGEYADITVSKPRLQYAG
jgi:hypothetical protein